MNRFYLLSFAIFLLSFLWSVSAFAENCDELNQNKTWMTGLDNLISATNAGDFDKALEEAKTLYDICSVSPTLLYYTGVALEAKNDKERALIYYQKASENTSQMTVEPSIARLIWYRRYELEHPERSEDAFSQMRSKIEEQNAKIEEQNAKIVELDKKNVELSVRDAFASDPTHNYKAIMWTGIGSAIGGIALIATGAVLAKADDTNTEIVDQKAKIKGKYVAGWALLGTGIGLTAIGGTIAGIAGYHYSKSKADAVISFEVSPNSASFSMTF